MCVVYYCLFGVMYEMHFVDLASARAFVCDFVEFYFEIL